MPKIEFTERDLVFDYEYTKTLCTCGRNTYKVCPEHRLIYCVTCDGTICPKCEAEIIDKETKDAEK